MPSPDDRLQELRRQRALVQQQLAFLDREIASASGAAMPAAQIPPTVSAAPSQPAAGGDVDEVIKSFEEESRSDPADAKSGCIWIFVAALVLFALSVFAFYVYVRFHQPPAVH